MQSEISLQDKVIPALRPNMHTIFEWNAIIAPNKTLKQIQ